MKYLWILLFVSCLALSEAFITGTIAESSGGGGNDSPYWASSAAERLGPLAVVKDGQLVLAKCLDRDGGALITPQGVTYLDAPGSPTETRWISETGQWVAGSSNQQAALWTVATGAVQLTGGFNHVYAYTVDNNGTMGGDWGNEGSGLGNQAFRKTLNGSIEQLMPGYIYSTVMATTASGSVVALSAHQVSGSPDRAFYFSGTGPAVELPSVAGETFTCPWAVTEADGSILVVGQTGTLYSWKPFMWLSGDAAKTILPPLGVRTKGAAACAAGWPKVKMIGGYLQSTSSDRKAVLWLPDGDGGLVARDVQQLVVAAGFPLGALKLTEVTSLSPDGKWLLTEVVDNPTSPTICQAIVLNLWYSTPLGTVKAQPVSSPVSVTTAPVIASYPGVFYIENMDRSAGIRVNAPGHSVKVGDKVTLTGTLDEVDGEKCISTQSTSIVIFPGQYPLPRPMMIPNSQVGSSVGLCNTGLLVKVCGRVKEYGSGYFVIYDGSTEAGLRVISSSLSSVPAPGSFVTLAGVSTRSAGLPAVWPRAQADILP